MHDELGGRTLTSTFGTVVASFGLVVAAGALIALVRVSGLGSSDANAHLLYASIGLFLFGIFVFGWGLGKRTGP